MSSMSVRPPDSFSLCLCVRGSRVGWNPRRRRRRKHSVGVVHGQALSVDLNHQTAPGYDRDAGCKWMLHNLKSYLMSRHDQQAVNVMFRCPPHPLPLTPTFSPFTPQPSTGSPFVS